MAPLGVFRLSLVARSWVPRLALCLITAPGALRLLRRLQNWRWWWRWRLHDLLQGWGRVKWGRYPRKDGENKRGGRLKAAVDTFQRRPEKKEADELGHKKRQGGRGFTGRGLAFERSKCLWHYIKKLKKNTVYSYDPGSVTWYVKLKMSR